MAEIEEETVKNVSEEFRSYKKKQMDREADINKRKIFIFKHFIGFLEIFGQENYGISPEDVDWDKVYRYIVDTNLFDFNDDLEEIVYNETREYDSEEFRDTVYKYIENHVLKGDFPVFRLFKLSGYLHKALEQEVYEKYMKEQEKRFDTHVCYKCKHYRDKVKILDPKGYSLIDLDYFKETYPDINPNQYNLYHEQGCKMHDKFVEEYLEECNSKINSSYKLNSISNFDYGNDEATCVNFNKWIKQKDKDCKGLLFRKRENVNSGYDVNFTLKPVKSCAYYDQNYHMSFYGFMEMYMKVI